MIEKLKDKIKRIISSDNTVIEPKKNLILIIITACIYFAVLLVIFFYTGDIKYLFVAVLSMIPLIIYAVYSFFKEKRHDKSSEKDKQEFVSPAVLLSSARIQYQHQSVLSVHQNAENP